MRFFPSARSRARRALMRALLASPLGTALLVHPAAASTTTGLPWETPLQTLQSSITGPVALAIALIAIVVAGGTLVFGGEINEFARRSVVLVLVIALIVTAAGVLTTLFGAGSALVL